jgi:hypothetical protein
MKNLKIALVCLFLTTITFFSCGDISGPIDEPYIYYDGPYDIDEPYDFPLKPGMPEWANLKTGIEKVNALQIPQDIASRMTTRSLLETCLNYPLFSDVNAYNNPKVGMEILIAQYFNGFPELLKRKDAYIHLSEKFISFDLLAITNEEWSLLEQGRYAFKLIKIELLLAQDTVLESASYESKVLLLKEALIKYEKMLTQEEYYSFSDYGQLFFLIGKILQNSGNPDISSLVVNNKEISKFLETGWSSYNVINEILSIIEKVIN